MTLAIKIILCFSLILQSSCNSSKTTVENQDKKQANITAMDEKLTSEGYSSGIVKINEDSDCPYIIVDEKTKEQFDPINFEEEKYASFKSAGSKIYVKFRRLRMPNRCTEAQPISLEDIKKRED